jgi:exosome complex RNA-binding protein Rrp42 (RNase PH superfamily)
MLERQIKDSRAIDLEALCITPGVHVWQLRCDVHVSCDDGNLADACSLGAIAAFMHFRRPDTTVHEDGRVETHSFSAKPPLPLSLHHIPVSVTLGLFGNPEARLRALDFTVASAAAASASASSGSSGASAPPSSSGTGADDDEEGSGEGLGSASSELAVMDPCALEEAVYNGRVTFVMNAHKELCGIHKLGGCPLPPALLLSATRVAGQRAQDLVALVRSAVAAADKEADERDAAKVVAAAVGAAPAGALQVAAATGVAVAAGGT